jgi:type II secretory pathway pseudopilin PulG
MYQPRLLRALHTHRVLVVIAIIGTIFTIILTALSVARSKGIDAAVRLNMDSARPQSELFYDANSNAYVQTSLSATDICNVAATGVSTKNVRGVYSSIFAAAQQVNISAISYNATPGTTVAVCNSTVGTTGGWAAQVPLNLVPGTYYCIDSTGAATTTKTGLSNGTDVTC